MEIYELKASFQDQWVEVSKEEWIKVERRAGFRPQCPSSDPNYWTTCATGGFGAGDVSGRIRLVD